MIVGAELSLPFVYALVIGGVILAAWAWRRKTRRAIYRAALQHPAGPYDWRVSCPELRQPTHVHRLAPKGLIPATECRTGVTTC